MTDDLKTKDDEIQESGDADQPVSETDTTAEPLPMEDELETARAEAAEYLAGWQRARAEFANYRKRTDRERADLKKHAAMETFKQFLPIIDDLSRALDNTPEELIDQSWVQGIHLIKGKIQSLMENSGLEEIDPIDEPFDPTQHEAIGMDDSSEVESGHVTLVLQKGYVYGETILRPALVRVAN